MSLFVAFLAAMGILLWPERFARHSLAVLPGVSSRVVSPVRSPVWEGSATGSRSPLASAMDFARRRRPGRSAGVSAPDLLGLLNSLAPALEAGMSPASALRIAADARSRPGRVDPTAAVASDIASAAADGAPLAPLWRRAAESTGSGELLLLAAAWSLTEDLGVPLAHAVRTTAALLEARVAHERCLAGAVAGAKATVNVLTVLPVGGPLLALLMGIGPAELYGGSRLTQGSLVLGLGLAGVGRWWVNRMIRAVAQGPMIA